LDVLVPTAVSRRQVTGAVGAVKDPPTEAWSRPLLKVWSRLDTGSPEDRVAASVGAPAASAAREVTAGYCHAAVRARRDDLVVTEVVDAVALVALAQGPCGPGRLY
jgi:hypothetical protein